MIGLDNTELMARSWQVANIINIVLPSVSEFWKLFYPQVFINIQKTVRGSTFVSPLKSEMILRVLMGAQERKKMKLTTISKEFVLFLRASWRDFLCDEKTEFVWRSSFWLILVYARATIAEGMRY